MGKLYDHYEIEKCSSCDWFGMCRWSSKLDPYSKLLKERPYAEDIQVVSGWAQELAERGIVLFPPKPKPVIRSRPVKEPETTPKAKKKKRGRGPFTRKRGRLPFPDPNRYLDSEFDINGAVAPFPPGLFGDVAGHYEGIADGVAREHRRRLVFEALQTLTTREEKVLRLRFGIGCQQSHTLREIGNDFGISPERVRQIEAKAFRKLRHYSRAHKLAEAY